MSHLAQVAESIVASPRVIVAADEGASTIAKRLESIQTPNTPENRHAYRELLFSTPVGDLVGGVILFQETLACRDLVDLLLAQGIVPGIKTDEGLEPWGNIPGEQVVKGYLTLKDRLPIYRDQGAGFTKARSLFNIVGNSPSDSCMAANARAQAQFALLAQEAGLVPIVEPEVELVGDHDAATAERVIKRVLKMVFEQLALAGVDPRGMILKPSMAVSGKDAVNRAGPEEVAERTLRALLATVPSLVPGIAFLSGGQGDDEADANLDAINRLALEKNTPWRITASFSRSLIGLPLKVWGGNPANIPAAQEAFRKRCVRVSAASMGRLRELAQV